MHGLSWSTKIRSIDRGESVASFEDENEDDLQPDRASNKLAEAITEQIDYFRKEFRISYAEAIGVLAMLQHELTAEALDQTEDS